MHRLWAAGVVGFTLLVAACTAAPTTTSTNAPVPDAHMSASNAGSDDVATSADDDTAAVGGEAQLPIDSLVEGDQDNASGPAGGQAEAASETEDTTSQQESTTATQADPGTTTTTTTGVENTVELDGLVDEVTELLADLDTILADLDADLAGVKDGLNQDEGDI